MFNLIPVSLLIGALGGILYIVSGHLSELNNNEEEENSFPKFNFKERLVEYINQLPLDTVKSQSLVITRKTLHRVRLALLKTDNHLTKLIDKISQGGDKAMHVKTNENDNIPDFWEKVAKPEEQTAAPTIETEVKIDFAVQDELPKKFFDPVRSQSPKATADVKSHRTSNGVDIKPAKISSCPPKFISKILVGEEISEGKPAKKTLKTKKSLK